MDWQQAVQRAQQIVHRCADPKPEQLVAHGARLVTAEAHLIDAHTVRAGDETFTADHILIATGRRPPRPPIAGIELSATHVEALGWEQPPRRLAVIGGGVIGMEFAYLFRRVESDVTVFETLDQILYMLDHDVSAEIADHATDLGIRLHTAARVLDIVRHGNELRLRAESSGRPGRRQRLRTPTPSCTRPSRTR